MRVYLENDVIFYDYQKNGKTPYWLYVEAFEIAADQDIANIHDVFMKNWFTASIVEQTIHCLMEARPNKDWSELKSKILNEIKAYTL